jgi:hypothetical protein
MSLDSTKMIYYSYVHSTLKYGIIFWGSAPLSMNIFKIQKRIIRVMSGSGKLVSCRNLFKELQILTLQSQYIFPCCFSLLRIKIILYLTWIFIILIPVIIVIYTYLLQICQKYKKESCSLGARSTITYLGILNQHLMTLSILNHY